MQNICVNSDFWTVLELLFLFIFWKGKGNLASGGGEIGKIEGN